MQAPSIPAVYMRGGTSKGVFLHASDLPPTGHERDVLLLELMGSPDPMQIDGMGGTFSSTSKVMVVEALPDGSIEYWFAQIGIDQAIVDWSGNCGNLTTAIAPFAIDEGLAPAQGAVTRVRLVNGNTGIVIEAEVQTPGGRSATTGDFSIAGVPGTGSPVVTRYLDPAGGVLGELLPTGGPTFELATPHGPITASLVDATHPYLFIRAGDVGMAENAKSVAELNSDPAFLETIEEIRASATVSIGRAPDVASATAYAPATPRIVLVSPKTDGIAVLAFSMGKVHRGLPMTGALCLAAAATVEGTVVAEASGGTRTDLRITHPLGITETVAETQVGTKSIRSLGIVRTARRLMDGRVYPRQYA